MRDHGRGRREWTVGGGTAGVAIRPATQGLYQCADARSRDFFAYGEFLEIACRKSGLCGSGRRLIQVLREMSISWRGRRRSDVSKT